MRAPRRDAAITAVALDYGGVITNPLAETAATFCAAVGTDPTALLTALHRVGEELGEPVMARLEVGAISEAEMAQRVAAHLPEQVRGALAGRPFGELWFRGRHVEAPVVALVAELRARGLGTALVTNNVAEWRPRWRAQLDVESLFDVVVDSSEVGIRKPDPRIYHLLLDRLGVAPESCLLADDSAENCAAAEELGMPTVLWAARDQGCRDVRAAALTIGVAGGRS